MPIHPPRSLVLLALLVAVLAPSCAASPPPSDSRGLRVAVCQIRCVDGDAEGNLERIELALAEAVRGGARIACFPETCILGWVNPEAHRLAHPIPGETTRRLAVLARRYSMMIAIGLAEKDGDRLHDSAILLDEDGELLLRHRKVNVLRELMEPPYAAGTSARGSVVETRHGRIGMLVCADTFRDELVAQIAAREPDLLLVPYGWAAAPEEWPEHGEGLAAWVAHTARRAGCPVVGTDLVGTITHGPWTGFTYGGQSVVASASGDVLAILADRRPEVRVLELP